MDKVILSAMVGSKAHHLDGPNSDTDTREVYIKPTSELLIIGNHSFHGKQTDSPDGDMSRFELGHFLYLATKCNPTILETMCSPVLASTKEGLELRELFPYVWNSKGVKAAFLGYAQSQRNALNNSRETHRTNKSSVTWLRILFNAEELLTYGTFTVNVGELHGIGETLREWKYASNLDWRMVSDTCLAYEELVKTAFEKNPNKETDLNILNEWLLNVRKNNW